MATSKGDIARAEELAAAVERAGGRTWRKVTTILDLYSVRRLTPAVRARLSQAFDQAGLDVSPSWDSVPRYDSIRLTSRRAAVTSSAEAGSPACVRRVTAWRARVRPHEITLAEAAGSSDVLWVEIESDNARVPDVAACLNTLLPGAIPHEALVDLLEAEPFPKVAYYEGHHPPLRGVAAFAADAEEGTDESAQMDFGRLAFHPIEMLSGERWLVSVWHPSRVYVGSREVDEPPASPPPDVFNRVANRWIQEGAESAGDLGTLILHSLGINHTDAGQTLHSWLDSWELDFFRRVQAGDALDTKTLTDLRGSIGEFSQRLRELRLKRKDEERSWFAGITSRERAEEVDQMLARALEDLRELSGLVRSSFDLVQLQIAQRQQHASISQQQASERVQRKLELVTGLVLVPTLVVGIFGANTRLPGGGSWSGFLLMVLLMLILGGLSYWWLRMARTTATQTTSSTEAGVSPAESAVGAPEAPS